MRSAGEACRSPPKGRRTLLSACDATDPKSRTRRSGSLPSLKLRMRKELAGTRCARPWNPSSQRALLSRSLSPFPKDPSFNACANTASLHQTRISLESRLFAKTPTAHDTGHPVPRDTKTAPFSPVVSKQLKLCFPDVSASLPRCLGSHVFVSVFVSRELKSRGFVSPRRAPWGGNGKRREQVG